MPAKILIIYTGGTIGMVKDPETSSLVPFDFERIVEKVPELKAFDFQVSVTTFHPLVDSSDMEPAIWGRMALLIEKSYDEYDGFVILHGTDTMAFSASALSFMLGNLHKPVVFTGSQLPMGTIRTDGKENLVTALEIAAAKKNNHALVPEVCIFFQDKLYRGNRTTKYNAENFRAFRSDNYPALAESGLSIRYNYPYIRYGDVNGKLNVATKMDTGVGLLKIYPGISRQFVHAVLNTSGLKALVLETFGSGNAPTAPWFLNEIGDALRREIIILNVTQCIAGSVEMLRYETGIHLHEMGVMSGRDITTEAAITKLMFLLGNSQNTDEIKNNLNKALRGEISE
ncbi:MAG: asparaginase [Breznakibacter sp.]